MSAMQRFYTALCRGLEVYDLDLAHLVQLTQIGLARVRVFPCENCFGRLE